MRLVVKLNDKFIDEVAADYAVNLVSERASRFLSGNAIVIGCE